MIDANRYSQATSKQWAGRVDDPADPASYRWHQVVKPIDLLSHSNSLTNGSLCLLGFCSDEGVKRNLGRPGAAEGPTAIRQALASLPWHWGDEVTLYDAGDIRCENGDLGVAQASLATAVAKISDLGALPIVLGGGHEVALGSYRGLRRAVGDDSRLGIINFDAHFDMRPFAAQATSGTMFAQIAAERTAQGSMFDYFCLGIQKSGNTPALFEAAANSGARYLLAEQLCEPAALQHLHDYIAACDRLYVTLCTDVIAAAYAPGVSAPQPLGLQPQLVRSLLGELAASGKMVGFDVAEVAPALDRDDQTAKLVAQLIFHLVDALRQLPRQEVD